jgi:hypothetical protein
MFVAGRHAVPTAALAARTGQARGLTDLYPIVGLLRLARLPILHGEIGLPAALQAACGWSISGPSVAQTHKRGGVDDERRYESWPGPSP